MIKRGLSVLLVLIFVFSVVPFSAAPVSAAEDFPDYAPEGLYTEGLGITEAQYYSLRARICRAARRCDAACDLSDFGFYYGGDTGTLIARLVYDYDPESFHVNGVSFSIDGSRKIVGANLFYNCTAAEYASKRAEMIASANEILSGIEGVDGLSDLHKALLLHDRLAVRCEYNNETYNSGEHIDDDYNAYGALVKHITMCEGYSKAYSYLLNRAGIRSYLVDSPTLGHMWNVVYIDGLKYHVDVTWDDSNPNRQGVVRHNYFLHSTERFRLLDHNAADYDETPVSTTYDGISVWTDSETEFVICGGNIYYMSGGYLYKWDRVPPVQMEDFTNKWYARMGFYYRKGYQCLASDGDYIYVSVSTGIYRYNPANGEKYWVYTYRQEGYWYIYGMTYRNGTFYIDPYNSPDFEYGTEKLYGFTVTYVPPAPHDHVPGETVIESLVEPTCTKDGSYFEAVYCTICGERVSREKIETARLGHDFVETKTVATCTEDGVHQSVCSRCGEVKFRYVQPARHKYGNTYTIKAKCTEDGGKKRICSVCGYVEWTDVTPALGHDFSDEFTVDREPTYTADGEMSRHCSRCRERTDITPIPKLDGVPGDVNGDGDVTMKDVLLMRRYIAGLDDLDDAQLVLGDMNGDGDITMKDVLLARRYIAGLD